MLQRDYLLNEARKFAQILARLLGLKAQGEYEEYFKQVNNFLQDEYDSDIEKLLAATDEEFLADLASTNYSPEKLNALATVLYVFAEPFKADAATKSILSKVLIIFDRLEEKFAYLSFENVEKRKIIYNYFKNNG